jgi:hypothetical protein
MKLAVTLSAEKTTTTSCAYISNGSNPGINMIELYHHCSAAQNPPLAKWRRNGCAAAAVAAAIARKNA